MNYFVDFNADYKKEYRPNDEFHILTVGVPIGNDERGLLYNEWGILLGESFDYYDIVYHIKNGKVIETYIKDKEKIPVSMDFIESEKRYITDIQDEINRFCRYTYELDLFYNLKEEDIIEIKFEKIYDEKVYIEFALKGNEKQLYFITLGKNVRRYITLKDREQTELFDLKKETYNMIRNYFLTKSKYRTRILLEGIIKDA